MKKQHTAIQRHSAGILCALCVFAFSLAVFSAPAFADSTRARGGEPAGGAPRFEILSKVLNFLLGGGEEEAGVPEASNAPSAIEAARDRILGSIAGLSHKDDDEQHGNGVGDSGENENTGGGDENTGDDAGSDASAGGDEGGSGEHSGAGGGEPQQRGGAVGVNRALHVITAPQGVEVLGEVLTRVRRDD